MKQDPPPSPIAETRATNEGPMDLPTLRARAGGEAPKTFGEHAHRFVQNILVNHVLNLAISFWFAHAADFGGKTMLGNGIHKVNNVAKQAVTKYPSLGIPISIFWLSTGGTVLVPIVRGMDDTKVKLSMVKRFDQWWDALRGKTLNDDEKQDRAEAYARIEHNKPLSWGKTLVARFSGIGFNFITEMALFKAHKKLLPVPGADPEKDYGYGWVGKKVEDDLRVSGKLNGANAEQRAWWARNIPLEVLSTVNAVAFYNSVYRWFQKDANEKRDAAQEDNIQVPKHPQPLDTTASEEDRKAAASLVPRKARPEPRAASYAEQATRERAVPVEHGALF